MTELPFDGAAFFEVFHRYNTAVWPAPVVAYAFAVVAVAATTARGRASGVVVGMVLAAMWLWTGLAYHWGFFAAINPVAKVFAAAFVAEGALLAHAGVRGRLVPFLGRRLSVAVGVVLVVYAAVLYPLVGAWAGHSYPAAPAFGITPCPLTLFTLGLLLCTDEPPPWRLVVVPVLWSLIGGSAAMLLGVVQDWPLAAAGVVTLALFHRGRRA